MNAIATRERGRRYGLQAKWYVVSVLVFVIVLAVVDAVGLGRVKSPETGIAVKPKVEQTDVKGIKESIDKARGKVLVVAFWATWCPPCVHETPELIKFYDAYKKKDVVFLSISADHPDTVKESVLPFMLEKKIPYQVNVIKSTESPDSITAVFDKKWAGGLPATFVYDAKGKLRKQFHEEVTFTALSKLADTLLKEIPPPSPEASR